MSPLDLGNVAAAVGEVRDLTTRIGPSRIGPHDGPPLSTLHQTDRTHQLGDR